MGIKFIDTDGCIVLHYTESRLITLSPDGFIVIIVDNKQYFNKKPLSQQDIQKADALMTKGGYFRFIDFTSLGSIFERRG